MKKVVVFQPIHSAGIEVLEREVELAPPPDDPFSLESVAKAVADVEGLIVRVTPLTAAMIQAGKRLQVIGRHGSGFDNVDIAAATSRRIPVVYAPGQNIQSVAEHTIGMMIGLGKKIIVGDRAQREGRYDIRYNLPATELYRKVLGIVGLGKIGLRVAEIATRAFDMSIVTYDPYIPQERADRVEADLVGSLDEVLQRADFVSLHVPLTEETKGFISARELALMKPTTFLINTSRGSVVNEEALIRTLEREEIAGAALDVFDPEPPSPDNPLFKMDSVITTPHTAGNSEEALFRMATTVAEQVLKALRGEPPDYLANPEVYESSA